MPVLSSYHFSTWATWTGPRAAKLRYSGTAVALRPADKGRRAQGGCQPPPRDAEWLEPRDMSLTRSHVTDFAEDKSVEPTEGILISATRTPVTTEVSFRWNIDVTIFQPLCIRLGIDGKARLD